MISKWILPVLMAASGCLLLISHRQENTTPTLKLLTTQIYKQLQRDSVTINRYFDSDHDRTLLTPLESSPFYIELWEKDSILYWNDKTTTIGSSLEDIAELNTIISADHSARIYLNITDFNAYLSSQSSFINISKTIPSLHKNIQDESYIDIYGHRFGVTITTGIYTPWLSALAWILFLVSFIILCIWLTLRIKSDLKNRKDVRYSILTLVTFMLAVKWLHTYDGFALLFDGFMGFKLLNPNSFLCPNTVNLVTNLWISGVLIYLANLLMPSWYAQKKYGIPIAVLHGFYTFFIFGISLHIIRGFVLSPDVNLEIEALMDFDIQSFVLIIAFSLLMILIFQSTQLLQEWLNEMSLYGMTKVMSIAAGWSVAGTLLYIIGWPDVPLWILVCFILAYMLILDAYTDNKEKKITYVIWWLIMFSGFLAVSLFYFGLKKDISEREVFLKEYYQQQEDNIVKKLVNMQDSLVTGDVFTRIASLENSSRLDMKDLYQFMFGRLPGEDNDIEISIELFDNKSGNTIFNNHFADYHKLTQSYTNARKVGRNVFHNPFEDTYFVRFEIDRSLPENASWYLYIICNKKNKHHDIHKALSSQRFGYAIFSRDKMIEKSDNNQSVPDLSMLTSIRQNTITGGYSFVISFPSDQYKIISWKKVSGLIKPISLFSFIFTLSGFILLLLSLVNTKYDFLPENISLRFGARSSLKTKIQLAIILLILLTFLIIGAITGFYFKNLIEANQLAKNKEINVSVINNIRSDIQNIADEEYAFNYLRSKLQDLSFIHNKELSLYDQNGKLSGSTFKEGHAVRIPFATFSDQKNDVQDLSLLTQNATNVSYIPVMLTEQRPFAYIGINHTTYNNSSGNILDFLSTILNAYIFLFLIAGAIAITIANSITQPLTILAEKLKKFKLGKTNELLEWKSNDEIGTLIHDYNNLTHELERSAGLLAKTERDMAWREMAKQVAHEIKNPLTPMKLSIQYLDRAAKDHPEKAQDLIPRISATLIEQIDNLSQIANEFSNFASMPQASNDKIILNEIVETIHDLFRKRDDMDINMIEPIDDLYVFADKNHLVRILNNLLKNAIQAIPENRRGKIEIELKRQGNDAVIRISDNGSGIPDHMRDKVFTPNFTTKSSGTGLGLAISANMIESFNGKIYFETKVGIGTDFYVSIPLMRLDDYFSDENRVSLD